MSFSFVFHLKVTLLLSVWLKKWREFLTRSWSVDHSYWIRVCLFVVPIAEEVNLCFSGVRDLSTVVNLPANDFRVIDSAVSCYCASCVLWGDSSVQAVDYDDMRTCCMCKNICVFSAVACECNKTNVSCTRHYNMMCKCPKEKKFLLGKWNRSCCSLLIVLTSLGVRSVLVG